MITKKFNHWTLWKEGLFFIIAVLILYNAILNLDAIITSVSNFFSIISPFIVGTGLAYFFSRPAERVEAKLKKSKSSFIAKRARGFSVLTVFLIAVAIISLIISYIMPIIVDNLLDFTSQIGIFYETLMNFVNTLEQDNWLSLFLSNGGLDSITEALSIQELLSQFVGTSAMILGQIITMSLGIINAVISLIICLYMLISKESVLGLIDRIAKAFIKEEPLTAIKSYIHKSNTIFFQFISAQFLDACILGTLATIMLLLLGVEYAVTLGFFLGLCNMIPYFGSMFASFLTGFITLFTGGLQLALLTGFCLLVLQQIDGNFIGPRITGDALSLNPMLVIFSIIVSGAYFGVLGMFVAVPIAAMLKMFLEDFLTAREKKLGMANANTEI